jgi:hypothetical protein
VLDTPATKLGRISIGPNTEGSSAGRWRSQEPLPYDFTAAGACSDSLTERFNPFWCHAQAAARTFPTIRPQ